MALICSPLFSVEAHMSPPQSDVVQKASKNQLGYGIDVVEPLELTVTIYDLSEKIQRCTAGGGGRVRAEKVETQKEFLELHASFFSSCELPPDQLDVDLNILSSSNDFLQRLYKSYCEPHDPCGVCFQNMLLKFFLHIKRWADLEA
ncbi:hypothetical protein Tco_0114940 [Tanacetum coccineum]